MVEPDELRRAVRIVAAGDALLSLSITGRVIAAFAAQPARSPAALDALTEREREVTMLAVQGLANGDGRLRRQEQVTGSRLHRGE